MTQQHRLEPLFRSDALQSFHELLSQIQAFDPVYRRFIRVRLVIDACMVQRELRWRLGGRQKPNARSSMQEAIDAGTLVLFAPTWLGREIEKHGADLAADTGVSEQRVLEEWHSFAGCIHFYEPNVGNTLQKHTAHVDPDDLPYKLVREQLGAHAIYSADADFDAMGEPRVNLNIDLLCRDYARAASIEVGITLGSGFTLTVSLEMVVTFVKFCIQAFRRLPPVARVLIVSAVALFLAHPVSRRRLVVLVRSTWSQLKQPSSPVRKILAEVARQFVAAQQDASRSAAAIRATLPPPKRPSALALARSICLVNRAPLSLPEIERRMRIEGYVSRSPYFTKYLQRLLRADGRFREVSPGSWVISTEGDRIAIFGGRDMTTPRSDRMVAGAS